MTGGTESACLAGEHQQPLLPTVRTPDEGKAAHGIAAIQVLLDDILDYRTEIPILFLEPVLILIRYAVGIEDKEDLLADLEAALRTL
jgi:hypothetical protein